MGGHWNEGAAPRPDEDLLVYSVGWLTHEDDNQIIMVQSLTDGSHGNSLIIPRGMVVKLQKTVLK